MGLSVSLDGGWPLAARTGYVTQEGVAHGQFRVACGEVAGSPFRPGDIAELEFCIGQQSQGRQMIGVALHRL